MSEDNVFQKLKKIIHEIQPPTLILPPELRQLLMDSETRFLAEEDIRNFQNFIKNRKKQETAHEVYPGILVGDELDATEHDYLKASGITHMLNVSQGTEVGQVNTTADDYAGLPIKFKGLKIVDCDNTNLEDYLQGIIEFIDDAIDNGGKVLVHCQLGISRSPSVAAAYLIVRKGFSAEEAVLKIRRMREIIPNNSFFRFLCALDAKHNPSQTG